MNQWPSFTVADLQRKGILLVEDGNHGQYRPRPDEFADEGVHFIRAADMQGGRVLFDRAGRINQVALQRVRKGVGQAGDVLFSHKGTVGKLARVPFASPDFVCSPQTTFWRTLDQSQLRRDYLYAFMQSRAFIDQWWVRKGETDMADYVSLTAQRQLSIVVPPVDTQQRIAEPLAAIDDLIENNRQRIEALEEMTQTIYLEWFARFRFPGHENATFVDSALGPIPQGWEVTTVGAVLELKYGKALKKADRAGGETSVVGSSGVVGTHNEPLLQGPSIIVGRKGNVGKVIWIPGPSWPIDTAYFVQTGLPLRYVAEQLKRAAFINSHAAVPGLSRDQAYSVDFLRPDDASMQRFQEVGDLLGQDIQALVEAAERLSAIRDLLLPKLITGEIDVSEPDPDALVEAAS